MWVGFAAIKKRFAILGVWRFEAYRGVLPRGLPDTSGELIARFEATVLASEFAFADRHFGYTDSVVGLSKIKYGS